MIDPATFNTLRQFRAGVYDRFGARRDALFELLDAATVAGLVAQGRAALVVLDSLVQEFAAVAQECVRWKLRKLAAGDGGTD